MRQTRREPPDNQYVKISVVVPAFNEERLLAGSLHSIRAAMAAFKQAGWSAELIVCDNNSTDRTSKIARAAGAKVVFEPINQIARARNTGAAHANGDWLIFVDADSYPTRELFGELVEEIRNGECIGGGSTVSIESSHRALTFCLWVWNRLSRITRWAAGSCMFCEAAAFRAVGGFSQELYVGEEIDLCRRLKRLADDHGRTIVILHRHPLRTSDRKIHLYTTRELFMFLVKTITRGGRTLRSPEHCFAWYDGRR